MWLLATKGEGIVSESDVMWPDLPPEIEIAALRYRSEKLMGFDFYGFQRFSINAPGGRIGGGVQLIGIKGDVATIIELDESTGVRRRWNVPGAELTYAPELLRHGRR